MIPEARIVVARSQQWTPVSLALIDMSVTAATVLHCCHHINLQLLASAAGLQFLAQLQINTEKNANIGRERDTKATGLKACVLRTKCPS